MCKGPEWGGSLLSVQAGAELSGAGGRGRVVGERLGKRAGSILQGLLSLRVQWGEVSYFLGASGWYNG